MVQVQVIFFFQAEDGIRDADVTGVQTCALPISIAGSRRRWIVSTSARARTRPSSTASARSMASGWTARPSRSEERRVGKECRAGWGLDHRKEKDRELCVDDERSSNDGQLKMAIM